MKKKSILPSLFILNFSFFICLAAFAAASDNPLLKNRPPKNIGAPPAVQSAAAPAGKGVTAHTVAKASADTVDEDATSDLNFKDAPVDMVFEVYSKLVGRTVLKDPATPSATITLESLPGQKLTKEEQIEAIEVALEMNGIHFEEYGEKFVRALPRKEARKEGIPLIMDAENKTLEDSGKVVSVMINFKNISAQDEAQKALEGFKSNSGLLQVFERTNSILVTDTQQNINRMMEIAKAIDISTPVMENVFVRQIKNASATEIKQALQEIVQESQKELEKTGKAQQNAAANAAARNGFPMIPGMPNRPLLGRRPGEGATQPQQPSSVESLVTSVSDADRGLIRGKVLILADERSNKLVIITSKANMDFFDKIIEQLDIETTPDTVVKVYRLKYAEAEDVSDMINDLIGNSASGKSSSKQNQNANAKSGTGANITTKNPATGAAKSPANQRTGEAKAGELTKDNTTVLADKRINGLVVMTQKELVATLEKIIESMDVKLSQVLIETVIIEVQLGDDISTGIDWVHGMQQKANGSYRQALSGGGGQYKIASAAGGLTNAVISAVSKRLPALFSPGGAGLTYGVYSERLDLGAVIRASKTDSHSKYIASPVIMTVDNKEATIDATQTRQFLTGYQVSSSMYSTGNTTAPQYTSKDLGITIKVTPKINPNGTVMLEVEEEYSQLGAQQTILDPSSKEVQIDTSLTRKMAADVLLEDSQTVVLGGLTETRKSEAEAGIPILKDIPWVGKYLFGSTTSSEIRNELLVFMTPYVLDDAEAAQAEALRRKKTLSDSTPWDDHGWSASELADPIAQKEQMRRLKDEAKRQDEERVNRLAIEKWKSDRAKELEKMNEAERKEWEALHPKEAEVLRKEYEKRQAEYEADQEALRSVVENINESRAEESAVSEPKLLQDMAR